MRSLATHHREPVFDWLTSEVAASPERYPHWAGVMPDYRRVTCPAIEHIQPKLVHMEADYFDLDEAKRQADILDRAIQFNS